MYNATIHVEKTNGSIDRVITLLVTGFSQGPKTVHFYPQDTKKAINFRIFDNDYALEPTEVIGLLSPTDRISLIEPHDKTTINIMDDDELLIGLTTQKVTVMEGNNATICVNISSEFVTNFNINVGHLLTNLTNITTAIASKDFFPSNFPIEAIPTEHGPGHLLCFNIHAIQDEFVEHEECFEIGISVPDSVSDRLMVELDVGKDTTVVCIEDNNR